MAAQRPAAHTAQVQPWYVGYMLVCCPMVFNSRAFATLTYILRRMYAYMRIYKMVIVQAASRGALETF